MSKQCALFLLYIRKLCPKKSGGSRCGRHDMGVTPGVFPGGRRGTEALLSSSGLYPTGDLWPTQPMCVTSGFNCALENTVPGVMQGAAPVHSRYGSRLTAASLGLGLAVGTGIPPVRLSSQNRGPSLLPWLPQPGDAIWPSELCCDVLEKSTPSLERNRKGDRSNR